MKGNEAGYCIICGAPLINSTDGIGCGCREMLHKCTYLHMKNNDDKTSYYHYWNVEASVYMKLFIEWAENKKFRSSFRKSFVPSVISFYQEKNYLSKKQLEIVKNFVYNETKNEQYVIKKQIEEKKKIIMIDYREKNLKEIIELTHKMWASQKAK